MGALRNVYPLGRSFGLIEGDPDAACEALLREMKRSLGERAESVSVIQAFSGVETGLGLLDPVVAPFEDRFIVVACPGAWSLYLDNSALFDASPPRLADLARNQSRYTIHASSSLPGAQEPSPIQQVSVYQSGGGLVRAISNQRDRGVWRFIAEGRPYPFEAPYYGDGEARFSRDHLRFFLSQLGVSVAQDEDLLWIEPDAKGFLLEYREQNPDLASRRKYTSLQELRRL